jgi:hypothetical protein
VWAAVPRRAVLRWPAVGVHTLRTAAAVHQLLPWWRRVDRRRGRLGEQARHFLALDDLDEVAGLDVPDLDERRLERNEVRVPKC